MLTGAEDKNDKKILNFRPLVIAAFGLLSGAVAYYLYFEYKTPVSLCALSLLPAVIYAAVSGQRGAQLVTALFLCFVFAVAGVISLRLKLDGFVAQINGGEYVVFGEVDSFAMGESYDSVRLKNVSVATAEDAEAYLSSGGAALDDSQAFEELKSEVRLAPLEHKLSFTYLRGGEKREISEGSRVALTAYVKVNEVSLRDAAAYNAVYDCLYSAIGEGDSLFVLENTSNGLARVKSEIVSLLYDNLQPEDAAVAYGMLVGNDDYVESDDMLNYRYSGISHIFAVSGMNVGLIYICLSALLKKIKINRYASAAVCVVALVFYTALCSFTVSAVRALIMCVVSLLYKLFGFKRDDTNALSISVIIIVAINPINTFTAGFILSVAATAGIIFLYHNLKYAFKFMPEKLSALLAVTLSAQLATLPWLFKLFGYVSALSIVTNLVFVPALSAIYILLFVATALALCCSFIPFAGAVLLFVPKYLLKGVLLALNEIEFSALLINLKINGAASLAYFGSLLALSDKANLSAKVRFAAAEILLFAAFVITLVLN